MLAGDEPTNPCVFAFKAETLPADTRHHLEVAVLKTFVGLTIVALAMAAEPVFAQTSNTPAPSPLTSAPATSPSGNLGAPATSQTKKKHSHRSQTSQPGSSTTGNQNN
jgi:hypothetical protein